MIAITTQARMQKLGLLLPTRGDLAGLALATCLCALGDPSEEAARIFALALPHAGRLYVPTGTRLLVPNLDEPLAGADLRTRKLRMGRPDQIAEWLASEGAGLSDEILYQLDEASESEAIEPLLVADQEGDLGLLRPTLARRPTRLSTRPRLSLGEPMPVLAGVLGRLPI